MTLQETWSQRFRELHPKRFFLETWRDLDREAAYERAQHEQQGKAYDYRPLIAFCVGALCLSLMEYFGHSETWRQILEHYRSESPESETLRNLRFGPYAELWTFVWWSSWRVLGYFIIPALTIKFFFKHRIRDYGLSTVGLREHAWIYVLSYLVVLACVAVVSHESSFRDYYPFYRRADRSWFDFGAWEILYAAQFFSLEFFFRGYWLEASKRSMGSAAIFAMVVPYCMIHFGKPFPETIAAIFAGVVLGTLSMKTKSIWSGFLIHVSVAISMDVAALLQKSELPSTFWPAIALF